MDIIGGRTTIANRELPGCAALSEELSPGFCHCWIRDDCSGFGAITCERKLWITGLNEASLQSRETRDARGTLPSTSWQQPSYVRRRREGANVCGTWDAARGARFSMSLLVYQGSALRPHVIFHRPFMTLTVQELPLPALAISMKCFEWPFNRVVIRVRRTSVADTELPIRSAAVLEEVA